MMKAKKKQGYDFSKARIEKIHFTGSLMKIRFSLDGAKGNRVYFDLKDDDNPHPHFLQSLVGALQDAVAKWVEVSHSDENTITIHEVRLKHVDENIGYKIIAYRAIQNARSPLKIETPLKWIDHADDKQKLDEDVVELLSEVVHEATGYLNGKRSQMSLFGKPKVDQVDPKEEEEEQELVAA